MMKRKILYILFILLAVSCSTTRYVPEGDKLYTGIKKVEFIDAEANATSTVGETAIEEVRYALDYAPNGSIAGSSSLRALPILSTWWSKVFLVFYDSSKIGFFFYIFALLAKSKQFFAT